MIFFLICRPISLGIFIYKMITIYIIAINSNFLSKAILAEEISKSPAYVPWLFMEEIKLSYLLMKSCWFSFSFIGKKIVKYHDWYSYNYILDFYSKYDFP